MKMYTYSKNTKELASPGYRLQYYVLILSIVLLPATAFSRDDISTNIIEISPGIGYYDFDDERNLEDTAMATIGLGLQFSRRWLALLHYSAIDYDSERPKVVIQKYHVDAHYLFNTENALRPYVVAGFGQIDIDDAGIESNKNTFNAGFGISYKLTPSWFVRTDARVFAQTDGDYTDNAYTLTLAYRFSGGERD